MAVSEPDPEPVGTFWTLDLQQVPDSKVVQRIAASLERAGPEMAASLAEAMGIHHPSPVLERLASRRCYMARVDGKVAGYCWVSFGQEWIGELGAGIRLQPDEAYIWDCATLPAYQGQGLYPAVLAHIVRELRDEGLRRAWIGADTVSVPSQKGIMRAGFQPVADVFFKPPGAAGPHLYVTGRLGVPQDVVDGLRQALFFNGSG